MAKIRTRIGAIKTAIRTSPPRNTEVAVTRREIKADPPSAPLVARTICGTKTAVRAPPINKLYKMLGIVLATLKVSPSNVVPSTATSNKPRIKPVTREKIVPTAITVEDFKSAPVFTYYAF